MDLTPGEIAILAGLTAYVIPSLINLGYNIFSKKSKDKIDDSQITTNFQTIVTGLQESILKQEKRLEDQELKLQQQAVVIYHLRQLLAKSHLEIELKIGIDQIPAIIGYKWKAGEIADSDPRP